VAFDFGGAHVLVTGGSNGIGLGVATAFADAGAMVTITGTREGAGDYDHDLSRFSYRRCRMADADEVRALTEGLDHLDVLVNNAGQNLPGGRDEWDEGVFEEVLAVNLVAPFRLAQQCHDRLAASTVDGGGSVVNVGSMASFFGMEMVPGYGAAKGGVVQMTKTLAVSWARDGIRVNAVAPGVVESNMTAPMLGYEPITGPLLARTPMGRFGTPDDIAPAVLFLASPAARYVTGQTLAVDGGWTSI
jgi:NAD(P)-dependent dehydrogenase (short-subunit alcohol dehydrogenase family)